MNSDMSNNTNERTPCGEHGEPTLEQIAQAEKRQQLKLIPDIVYGYDDDGYREALAWLMEVCHDGGSAGKRLGTMGDELSDQLFGNGWCEVGPHDAPLAITAEGYQRVIDAYRQAAMDGYDVSEQLENAFVLLEVRQNFDREVDPSERANIVFGSANSYHLMPQRIRTKFWDEIVNSIGVYPLSERDQRLVVAGFASGIFLSVCDRAAQAMENDAETRLRLMFDLETSRKEH